MAIPIWKGSAAVHLQPGSPHRKLTASGLVTTLLYRAKYQDLITNEPVVGTAVDGYQGLIESVETVPDGAGVDGPGTQTVVILAQSGVTSALQPQPPLYEIDSATLEKRLEAHPRYNGAANSPFLPYSFSPGANLQHQVVLNSSDPGQYTSICDIWERFKSANSVERPNLRGEIPPGAPVLLEMIDNLALKWGAGIESYIVPAPVARKTSYTYIKPVTGSVGKRGEPAGFPDLPAGYVWLKTADRGQRHGTRGKWEHVEEWTAADRWDVDLYPAA